MKYNLFTSGARTPYPQTPGSFNRMIMENTIRWTQAVEYKTLQKFAWITRAFATVVTS